MKFTLAIEEMEYAITGYENDLENGWLGDFKLQESEIERMKNAIANLELAINVLKNEED